MKLSRLSLKIIPVLLLTLFMSLTLSACVQNSAVGSPSETIGEDRAKQIALEDCGEKEEDIVFQKSSLDFDDGIRIYEFDFYAEKYEYEYEINAETGKIVKKSKETRQGVISTEAVQTNTEPVQTSGDPVQTSPDAATTTSAQATEPTVPEEPTTVPPTIPEPQTITLEQAKAVALSDSGVLGEKAVFTKQKQDYEDNRVIYEIEFYDDVNEYEYEIDLYGNIIKKEVEPLHASASKEYITADKAIAAALSHAGLTLSQVTEVKAEFDWENSGIYEVEFRSGRTEYEYVINAADGSVIHFETEIDD